MVWKMYLLSNMAISDIYVKFRVVSYWNLGKNRTIPLVLLQILGKFQSDSNLFQSCHLTTWPKMKEEIQKPGEKDHRRKWSCHNS